MNKYTNELPCRHRQRLEELALAFFPRLLYYIALWVVTLP
jgi:hypothetical protein